MSETSSASENVARETGDEAPQKPYRPHEIEPKWQAFWEREQTFRTEESSAKKKAYVLDMFPYPSGAGLHVGHPEGYTATDILCRYLRATGHNVLHPMGWDAFGLPAEQYAIEKGIHPRVTTQTNIDTFRTQIKSLGLSYDWSREVDTTDPNYVKWTQWIFLLLFDRGLAFQDKVMVNWCPALGTVLANEEVKDGRSERGNHPVVRQPLRQWMLKITAYADRLLEDLRDADWPEGTRVMQSEWIGRSEGAEVRFSLEGNDPVEVFTTRPDTLCGATFLVLAPEHPLVAKITTSAHRQEVDAYLVKTRSRSEMDRRTGKEKTGVWTGAFAKNPVNDELVPVWIADYVLWGYGTGAIMAVPGHDQRDFDFARTYKLPIKRVVADAKNPSDNADLKAAFEEEGVAVNSGQYDGLTTTACKARITDDLVAKRAGKKRVEYKLRDWVFSRQRYWGEPIPIYFPVETNGNPVNGDAHTIRYDQPIAVAREELPLRLPELDNYQPGDDPSGPLARALSWRFFQKDGKWFARETNTMPQWAGSCWYYLRYIDPHNPNELVNKAKADAWLPVDLYVGGAEHAVLHLLYARFWHKVLFDAGIVSAREPFKKLVHQGMILGEVEYTSYRTDGGAYTSREHARETDDGFVHKTSAEKLTMLRVAESDTQKKGADFVLKSDASIVLDSRAHKMSKSRGNVVNPDDIVKQFGADSLRLYEMFMGPLEAVKPWNTASIQGVRRFLDRLFVVCTKELSDTCPIETRRVLHRATKKVTEDIEALRFNTVISTLMTVVNEVFALPQTPREVAETLTLLVHPLAPHVGEELWERLGHKPSIQHAAWPKVDPAMLEDLEVEVPVQVNGKVRGRVRLAKDLAEDLAFAAALLDEGVKKNLDGKEIVKRIYVPNKMLTFVVK